MIRTAVQSRNLWVLQWLGLVWGCAGLAFGLVFLSMFWLGQGSILSHEVWRLGFTASWHVGLWEGALFSLIWFFSLWGCGLLLPVPHWGFAECGLRSVGALCLGLLLRTILSVLIPIQITGLLWAVMFTLSVMGLFLFRHRLLKEGFWRRKKTKTLILGAGRRAQVLCDHFKRQTAAQDHLPDVVGYVHFPTEREILREQVIHLRMPLAAFVDEHQIDQIVVALDDRRNALPLPQLMELHQKGIQITEADRFFEQAFGFVYLPWLDPSRFIFQSEYQPNKAKLWVKRFVDVLLSGFLLALLAIPFGICFLFSWSAGRPLFQLKARILGQHQEKVDLYHLDVDALPYGLIRLFHPERWSYLWHVFRGDLSFIGPHWIYVSRESKELAHHSKEAIFELESLVLKPGLIHYRPQEKDISAVDTKTVLGFDLYYVKNSFLDLDWHIWARVLFGDWVSKTESLFSAKG